MPQTAAGERTLGRAAVWPVVLSWACAPSAAPPLQQVLSRPPIVVHHEPVTTRPLEVRNQKLYVEATVHGQTRTLLFDTGSPTMLDRRFAETLGLEVVGTNTGRDANGRDVTMDVAVLDTLSLGGFAARRVPVLIFDFHQLHLGRCLFDGGVLGSELLAAAAWRIDTERGALEIGPSGAFPAPEAAVSLPLHDFGYPHAPVVDYRVGDVSDKALFDTGNANQMVLFERVAEAPGVRAAAAPGSEVRGRGSDGVSAGGLGAVRDQVRFTLSEVGLGAQSIGPVRVTTRSTPPTLLGAGLLERYVVTIDHGADRLLLEPRSTPEPASPEPGWGVTLESDGARISRLFDGSRAAEAGLQLGDRVTAIDDRPLVGLEGPDTCDAARFLFDEVDWMGPLSVTVARDGASTVVVVPSAGAGE